MKYALILDSDLDRPDWICHAISPSKTAIEKLSCYKASVIKLSKSIYPGTIEAGSLIKLNCETQERSSCTIVSLSDLQMSGSFNMSNI